MTIALMARLSGGLRGLPRPLKAGLWIGSAGALLYALTLLTHGRTDRTWMSPPPRADVSSTAAVEEPARTWTAARPASSPEAATAASAGAPAADPSSSAPVPVDLAAKPTSGPRLGHAAKPQSRGMKARRARRSPSPRVREPIEYRLADRPGI
jgi:hypothetical protein